MPNTALVPNKSKLWKIIEDQFEESTVSPIPRKFFNGTHGLIDFLLNIFRKKKKKKKGKSLIQQYGVEENVATLELLLEKQFFFIILFISHLIPFIFVFPFLIFFQKKTLH